MEGQYRLGVAYEDGLGTGIDLDKARWWYEQAAEPRSGVALKRSWLSGTTYGQLLPYADGEVLPGHSVAGERLRLLVEFRGLE
jgi:TPR repeat protein